MSATRVLCALPGLGVDAIWSATYRQAQLLLLCLL